MGFLEGEASETRRAGLRLLCERSGAQRRRRSSANGLDARHTSVSDMIAAERRASRAGPHRLARRQGACDATWR